MSHLARVEDVVYLSRWGQRWLKHAWNIVVAGGPAERLARSVLGKFDEVTCEPLDYTATHIYENTHTVLNYADPDATAIQSVVREKKVILKGQRSKFSAAVAKLAYNKFGERPMSEANLLVTRRWIQKLLEGNEYKDLRTVDKNIAIDRALFLSFVPTKDFQKMRMILTTAAWEERNKAENVFGGFWSRVFGVGPVDPSLPM
jgi:hypothetical protein